MPLPPPYLTCRLGKSMEKNTGDLFQSQKCHISLLPKFYWPELNHMAPANCEEALKMMSSVFRTTWKDVLPQWLRSIQMKKQNNI